MRGSRPRLLFETAGGHRRQPSVERMSKFRSDLILDITTAKPLPAAAHWADKEKDSRKPIRGP